MARKPVFNPLPVSDIRRLTDDSVMLSFDVPDQLREDYRFAPGQHVNVRTNIEGDDVRRSYSICSDALSGRLRVAVKRLPGGVFSSYVNFTLQPGETIDVMTPTGHFSPVLDPTRVRHYAAIAAGSGITPILSIISTALQVEPQSQVTLIYGNRSTRTVMFLEELEDLKNRYPERMTIINLLSRERQPVELFNGRITKSKLEAIFSSVLPVDTVDEWYLCGPFAMVQETRELLVEQGADPAHVHLELFHVDTEPRPRRSVEPAEEGAGKDTSAVTVLLDGRGTTFELAPDTESILDAALAVREDAPYACKNGMCGTCRAKLVEGDVEMDHNYALQPEEVESGFVLACQSYPTAPIVVLDFDA
jgi:ring-1,2-phenylacetyl-CoA epoxidase subunit PaaE